MFKFVRSATLAALLVGVALVIQGCGGISASTKCSDGREVKASCSGDSAEVKGSAPMEKAKCDEAKKQLDQAMAGHQQPGMTVSISCSGGKMTATMKMKIPKGEKCTKEGLDQAMKAACSQSPMAFSAKQTKTETLDDSTSAARSIAASSQAVADVLTGVPHNEKTTAQNSVVTDAKTLTFGAPDKLSKSIVAETQQVFNNVKVAMHSNSEPSDTDLIGKLLYMALGGLVVGAAFLAYHIKIVKHLQARGMNAKSAASQSLEMAPSSCTA